MLKIHGVPFSAHTRKVILAALEKQIPYEIVPVIPLQPPAGWTQLSPLGLIPAIVDGDLELADSTVICQYLDRAYGGHQSVSGRCAAIRARALDRGVHRWRDCTARAQGAAPAAGVCTQISRQGAG